MKRVGIVGLLHESNTFVEGRTKLADFSADLLAEGEAVRAKMANAPHEIGGFFEGLDATGIEAVPIFAARALPYGTIDAESFSTLRRQMIEGIREAGALDGILAAPHGATVAEDALDADGTWLAEVRELIGNEIPFIATIDPHANLSPKMVEVTDALIAYSTNPHLDQRETGRRAAELMAQTLAGEISPTQRAAFPSLAINIQSQNTSEEPMRGLYASAKQIADREGVVSHSIVLGLPYADVPEMGSSVLVVTDADAELAQFLADQMACEMDRRKSAFEPEFLSIEDAVRNAKIASAYPIVLLDMGDNVGGGSPANSAGIAREWIEHGEGRAFVVLCDPEAVQLADKSGVDAEILTVVGDPQNPIKGTFRVQSLHDGVFHEEKPRHGGFLEFDQGRTAVLETADGRLTIMATTRRMAPYSLSQLTSFGINPSAFQMIIAKGVIAPMAAYEPIAKGGFLHVDSPGVTRANMRKLDYLHRRRPLFPFE